MTAARTDHRAVVAELLAIWHASSELNEVTLRGDLAHTQKQRAALAATSVLTRGTTGVRTAQSQPWFWIASMSWAAEGTPAKPVSVR